MAGRGLSAPARGLLTPLRRDVGPRRRAATTASAVPPATAAAAAAAIGEGAVRLEPAERT